MHSDIQLLIAEIREIYKQDFPVQYSWLKSCEIIGLHKMSVWRGFGYLFSKHPDLIFSSNPYHNHYHTSEAVLSAAVLLKHDFTNEQLQKIGPVLLFTMLCHDLAHSGKHNTYPYELERRSCASVKFFFEKNTDLQQYWKENLLRENGDFYSFFNQVEAIILGTDFNQDKNINVNKYSDPDSINKIYLLANEADTLPSCLSELGYERASRIAIEQKNPNIAKKAERLKFLKKVQYKSNASNLLGITEHIEDQIKELEKKYYLNQ